jgi:hypothetical protein
MTQPWRWKLVGLGLGLLLGACQPDSPQTPVSLPEIPADPQPLEQEELPPPPAEAFLAQIPPDQATSLQALGVEVLVPALVPPGFSLAEVITDPGSGGGPGGGPEYQLLYRSEDSRCFAVEFVSGGIGDPPDLTNRLPIDPPRFPAPETGTYAINHGSYAAPEMQADSPDELLYSDWLVSENGAYRLISGSWIREVIGSTADNCQTIAPELARDIAESLTDLDGDDLRSGRSLSAHGG